MQIVIEPTLEHEYLSDGRPMEIWEGVSDTGERVSARVVEVQWRSLMARREWLRPRGGDLRPRIACEPMGTILKLPSGDPARVWRGVADPGLSEVRVIIAKIGMQPTRAANAGEGTLMPLKDAQQEAGVVDPTLLSTGWPMDEPHDDTGGT
jgi:hypothetical protein